MLRFKDWLTEDNSKYDEAEEHLSKANDAEREGRMKDFHLHMADHHDAMSEWHDSKGRSGSADKHAEKAEDHHEKAMSIKEATYQGREVPLNKPMAGDVKKSKVYVKNSKGNVVKVNFGDKTLSIKKNQPARKKSYCARSSGQGNLTDKTKANYWSRRAWDC